jgi:competence protein ComEA
LSSALAPRGTTVEVGSSLPSSSPDPGAPAQGVETAVLFVHILGEVKHPGLYEFATGDRAVDAVAAAGGFTKKADQAGLNLARELSDGEQIVVPRVGAVATSPPAGTSSGLVNLNTADAAVLETLPGIGPALSSRILAWRESNGSFASVDDLGNVAGIGEKTLGALRDLVTV